jgi:hypothetical protein
VCIYRLSAYRACGSALSASMAPAWASQASSSCASSSCRAFSRRPVSARSAGQAGGAQALLQRAALALDGLHALLGLLQRALVRAGALGLLLAALGVRRRCSAGLTAAAGGGGWARRVSASRADAGGRRRPGFRRGAGGFVLQVALVVVQVAVEGRDRPRATSQNSSHTRAAGRGRG